MGVSDQPSQGQFTRLPLRGGSLSSQAGDSGSSRSDELLLKPEGEVAILSGTQDGHEPLIYHPTIFTAQTRVTTGP